MTTVYIYCLIFVPGLFGETPCGSRMYGEHCDKHCDVNCRSDARNETYCDKDTGDCLLGCVSGRWGSQCNFPCSKNCVDRVCFQQTGLCSKGCTENYRGDLCEEYIGTNPQTLTTDPSRIDPPEETHLGKLSAVTAVIVAVVVTVIVSVVGTAVVICCVCVYRIRWLTESRYQESGESTDDKETGCLSRKSPPERPDVDNEESGCLSGESTTERTDADDEERGVTK